MNLVFRKCLDKFVVMYLDDIVVYNKTFEEHLEHLKMVFEKLREHYPILKREKCAFAQEEVGFRRHFVRKDASDFALGGVLLQEEHPIAFESKKLHDAERSNSCDYSLVMTAAKRTNPKRNATKPIPQSNPISKNKPLPRALQLLASPTIIPAPIPPLQSKSQLYFPNPAHKHRFGNILTRPVKLTLFYSKKDSGKFVYMGANYGPYPLETSQKFEIIEGHIVNLRREVKSLRHLVRGDEPATVFTIASTTRSCEDPLSTTDDAAPDSAPNQ
uniref:Reverse transcriptase domain-containing protein n=1 Tax=Chenopodium quinoa TaxID=63459 RepID=A0A803NA81_CHEQI